MDRQQNKTLEISSRRASSFFNFDEKSRLNRDRRPRVPASSFNLCTKIYRNRKIEQGNKIGEVCQTEEQRKNYL